MKVNTERLLDLVIVARPHASPDDVRKLAPILAPLPDGELRARIAKAKRRKDRLTSRSPASRK